MKPLTLEEVIGALEGTIDRVMPKGGIGRVTTDSRDVRPGDLFIAIRGDKFDGHDFVGEALHAGAVAAVVAGDYQAPRAVAPRAKHAQVSSEAILIRVDHPVAAMGRLARYYRRSILGASVTVIAVTGSNGKTTTKGMIAHILSGRWPGRASVKSFNNEIGVPVTLLSAEPSDRFVICEVGMNAPGEIATLARMVEPEIAVVTGVGPAHLERLGSVERIAVEKLSLLHSLRAEGCGLVNVDHEAVRRVLATDPELADRKVVRFGQWEDAELRLTELRIVDGESQMEGPAALRDSSIHASNVTEPQAARLNGRQCVEFTVNDRFTYRLFVPGRHNAFNALAAIGVARRMGMDHEEIAARLESFSLPPMRLQYERVGELSIINDAYNANPASLAAAVGVLADVAARGRRVLIVGDMRELGAASEELHRQAAMKIADQPIDLVIAVGENARLITQTIRDASGDRIKTHAYATTALARRRLVSHVLPTDTVLLKGSRAMALEELVEVLRSWAATQAVDRKEPRASTRAEPARAER